MMNFLQVQDGLSNTSPPATDSPPKLPEKVLSKSSSECKEHHILHSENSKNLVKRKHCHTERLWQREKEPHLAKIRKVASRCDQRDDPEDKETISNPKNFHTILALGNSNIRFTPKLPKFYQGREIATEHSTNKRTEDSQVSAANANENNDNCSETPDDYSGNVLSNPDAPFDVCAPCSPPKVEDNKSTKNTTQVHHLKSILSSPNRFTDRKKLQQISESPHRVDIPLDDQEHTTSNSTLPSETSLQPNINQVDHSFEKFLGLAIEKKDFKQPNTRSRDQSHHCDEQTTYRNDHSSQQRSTPVSCIVAAKHPNQPQNLKSIFVEEANFSSGCIYNNNGNAASADSTLFHSIGCTGLIKNNFYSPITQERKCSPSSGENFGRRDLRSSQPASSRSNNFCTNNVSTSFPDKHSKQDYFSVNSKALPTESNTNCTVKAKTACLKHRSCSACSYFRCCAANKARKDVFGSCCKNSVVKERGSHCLYSTHFEKTSEAEERLLNRHKFQQQRCNPNKSHLRRLSKESHFGTERYSIYYLSPNEMGCIQSIAKAKVSPDRYHHHCVIVDDIHAAIDRAPTEIEEISPIVLRYRTPYFRASAEVIVPPIPGKETWTIGWIQACDSMKFINEYGDLGSSSWEIPALKQRKITAVSDSDGVSYPWYGNTTEIASIEGPTDSSRRLTLRMNDNFHPSVTWDIPISEGSEAHLTHITRDQSFTTWLAAVNQTTGRLEVLRTVKWHFYLEIDVDPTKELGRRACVVSPKEQQQPLILKNNADPVYISRTLSSGGKNGTLGDRQRRVDRRTGIGGDNNSNNHTNFIPKSALVRPSANNAQTLIWRPTRDTPVIVVPPKEDHRENNEIVWFTRAPTANGFGRNVRVLTQQEMTQLK